MLISTHTHTLAHAIDSAKFTFSFLFLLCPDFALAALAAPLILPRKYCGGEFNAVFDQLYLDAKLQVEREAWGGGEWGRGV